jgi:hypothetical protein
MKKSIFVLLILSGFAAQSAFAGFGSSPPVKLLAGITTTPPVKSTASSKKS